MRMTGVARATRTRRRALTGGAALAGVAVLASLALAAPASAGLRNDLRKFSDCPYNTFGVSKCVYSVTNTGEFKLGSGVVPITVPVTIQGGLNGSGELIPATDGNTLSKSAEPIPGGLVGIELIGNFTEVTATAELAGKAFLTAEAILPLKAKLDNPLDVVLGNNCYIGSDAEPISLDLLYGPDMEVSFQDHQILTIKGTLEDTSFAAPGANGCTVLPLVGDLAVDVKEGLPAASGNVAKMGGTTEEVSRRLVKEVLPLPAFGHCVKLPGESVGKKLVFKGFYTDAGCVKPSVPVEGHFEWVEGVGAKKKFTGSSAAVTMQTIGGATNVKCAGSTTSGEYTGPKTEIATLTLTGCQTGPATKLVTCQSSGAAAGEIKTAALEGGLDFIKENEEGVKPEVGVDFKAPGNLISFECGGVATTVSGSVIAPITTVNKMGTAFKLTPKQGGGKQAVEAFEESAKDILTFKSGASETAGGLGATLTNTNEEPLEIKAEA
jgi:hypothetical protein